MRTLPYTALSLALQLLLGAGAWGADTGAAARNAILANFLFKHFTIGQDAPAAWFTSSYATSAAAWDARVAYMSGGVGQNGAFPFFADMNGIGLPNGSHTSQMDAFIMDCQSIANGKQVIPWITFYNIAQSYPALYQNINVTPPTPNDPADATIINAEIPATMLGYYKLFKWTMQRCATYAPYPIVVQLEPDGWTYMLTNGPYTIDPATGWIHIFHPESAPVCVASSGLPELSDLPNTLIGYAKGLKRLRDMYAPNNVLLCTNPSGWDYQYSMSGSKMGAYWSQMCSDWDLADFEFGDRDQGCSGNPPFTASGGAANEGCGVCGTYANAEQWISQFHAASGLYVLMWQVACGNTYYTSCNQTTGHYCDNHIQHLLESYATNTSFMDAYIASGCIGWMFNAGQGFQTHVYDELNDGVTNPAAIANTEGHVPFLFRRRWRLRARLRRDLLRQPAPDQLHRALPGHRSGGARGHRAHHQRRGEHQLVLLGLRLRGPRRAHRDLGPGRLGRTGAPGRPLRAVVARPPRAHALLPAPALAGSAADQAPGARLRRQRHPPDHRRAPATARFAFGILLDDLSATAASRLATALDLEGIDVEPCAEEDLPALPRARVIRRIELGEHALAWYSGVDQRRELPWSQIAVVALGSMRRRPIRAAHWPSVSPAWRGRSSSPIPRSWSRPRAARSTSSSAVRRCDCASSPRSSSTPAWARACWIGRMRTSRCSRAPSSAAPTRCPTAAPRASSSGTRNGSATRPGPPSTRRAAG